MKKQLFLFIFVFILLAIGVTAASALTQVSSPEGWTVGYPQYEFLKEGRDFKLHTHIFNQSGSPINPTTASCALHLYNDSGSHLIEEYMGIDGNGLEYSFTIGGGNLTYEKHAYIIFCNNSYEGAFVSGILDVTHSGVAEDYIDSSANIALIIFLLFIIGGLYLIAFKMPDFSGNIITDFILRKGTMVIATFLLLLSTAMVSTIVDTANINLVQDVFMFLWVIKTACYLLIMYLFIGTAFKFPKLWQQQLKNKRMGDNDAE